MKHKGSISQTYIRRDNEVIPSLYSRAADVAEYPINVEGLFEIAANLPVRQFYISDDAAIAYIRGRVLNNRDIRFKSPYKQKVFEALYDIVIELMNSEKHHGKDIPTVTLLALTRPAPCIGLSPQVIKQKYLVYKKKSLLHRRHDKV